MPPKRPGDGALTGAAQKRQRMREQRTIPVEGGHARAGGSAGSGNVGLPPVLEVEKFAQARAFEISAMQRAMKTAKEAGTQRAFQSLPRHLRRRAASHNIRRLPERLRARARGEVPKDAAKPKRVTRSMLGRHRQRPGLKAEMFRKRQADKMWLETHVWHAKRMHMTEIWGHRLADRPTAKAFRSSYRASQHGALVHDASYMQYFELEGAFENLKVILDEVCDPAAISPASKRYSSGAREISVDVHDPESTYPHGRLGPATFIWKPEAASEAGPIASTSTSPPPLQRRTLLIRVHPAVARLAALALERVILDKRLGLDVALRRFDKEFLTFEITGRRATEVVKAVLKPTNATDGSTKKAWRALDPRAGPAGVPSGMIIGLDVYDPRLSFPPQLEKTTSRPDESLLPAPAVAEATMFWNAKHRSSIKKPRYKKAELDARRAENLVPGTRLEPLAQDDRIPILLSQRTVSAPLSAGEAVHGWTLTVPAGWGMAFWSSLVYSTPRVGGLRERSQQYQEARALRFPEDAVDTPGFGEYEVRREADEKGYWDRRPPAKRPSYDKLGTTSPFRVDMAGMLSKASRRSGVNGLVPFVLAPSIAERVLSSSVTAATSNVKHDSRIPSKSVTRQRADQLEEQLKQEWIGVASSADTPVPDLLASAMVHVRITPCTRGVPQDYGMLYELSPDVAADVRMKVEMSLGSKKAASATGEGDGPEDLCERPKPDQVVGRITTGSFSLSDGRGCGVAVISLASFLRIMSIQMGKKPLVLFRNRDVDTFRAAFVDLL